MTRQTVSTPPSNGELEALLEYLHERRNFDFRGYKRASLSRRIFKRMQAIGVDDYQRYIEVLEANPGEFAELFNTILINVTSLMRDADAWEALAASVIPAIIDAKAADQPIRVWSAGTASGEEAYSLAVLFADALGEDRFRRSVKIYATDADSDALADARHGRYREADLVKAFGEERTSRFFELEGEHGVFRGDLRRALIFGRHDLVQDPPISRIDLIACRNTLMYFTSDIQAKILASFHFALSPGGYLFLGKSEALATRSQMFQVIDLRQHILRKDGTNTEVTLFTAPPTGRPTGRPAKVIRGEGGRLAERAFEHGAVAQVVLDADAIIVLANRAARRLLAIGSAELGRHLREAEFSFRPADLRGPVDRVLRERRPVTVYDVAWQSQASDEPATLDVLVAPLEGSGGVLITFLDVTRYQHLREELERSRRELETAYEELQSTVEELETTNEELQSTNEELETTNEELHSTNEELETMNEELQSTNEELEAINNELRERSAEVSELNQFLQSILGSLQSGVVVLGPDMDIRAWNRQAEELWGLRGDEVMGQHFLNLDIGFPVDKLRAAIRNCVSGRSEREQVVQAAVNRRGRAIECTVRLSRLIGDGSNRGVILIMDAAPRDGSSPTADTGSAAARADGQRR
jgi:two-component system CheB/CheR fusion protein